MDLSDCSVEKALQIIEESKNIIKQQDENSILALTNLNNDNAFLPDLFHAMKDLALHNKPYVKASAVIVYKELHRIFIDTMAHLSEREFNIFDDFEKAKDWLVEK